MVPPEKQAKVIADHKKELNKFLTKEEIPLELIYNAD